MQELLLRWRKAGASLMALIVAAILCCLQLANAAPVRRIDNVVPSNRQLQTSPAPPPASNLQSRPTAPDAHSTAEADMPPSAAVPSSAHSGSGMPPIYIGIVERVPVRLRVPPAYHRGELASRSGALTYRIVEVTQQVRFDIAPIVTRYAKLYHVDPYLVKAVIFTESHFHDRAVSHCGACGLMQLMPGTGSLMGARNLFDPQQNIAAGTRYLHLMLVHFHGNLQAALSGYNAGPMNVPRSGAVPNIAETRRYVRKVMTAYRTYKRETIVGSGGSTPTNAPTSR